MKKIDVKNSLMFDNKIDNLRAAIEYLTEEGYFSDHESFHDYKEGTLVSILVANKTPLPYESGHGNQSYRYFIPKDKVVFIEGQPKKLRPFKSSWEFTDVTGCNIGDVITIRRLDKIFEESCIVNGYKLLDTGPSTPHCVYISLGANEYSLVKLMRCFEYAKGGEWYPFGVEE